MHPPMDYAAVILAGGTARRLGGVDKPALAIGGRSMLERVLDAVADAEPRVVVGPPRPGMPADVLRVREEPPGGGPVAALAIGVAAVPASVACVALLAADLPYLTSEAVARLRRAVEMSTVDGAVLVDDRGRAQLLCGVWRAAAVRSRLSVLAEPTGQSMRDLVAGLRIMELAVTSSGSTPPPWFDCDTEEDLRRAEEWPGMSEPR
jgi:molybdenum cofactor guanylyltransferase